MITTYRSGAWNSFNYYFKFETIKCWTKVQSAILESLSKLLNCYDQDNTNYDSLEKIFVSASSSISGEWEFHRKYARKNLSLNQHKKTMRQLTIKLSRLDNKPVIRLTIDNKPIRTMRLQNIFKCAHRATPNDIRKLILTQRQLALLISRYFSHVIFYNFINLQLVHHNILSGFILIVLNHLKFSKVFTSSLDFVRSKLNR